MFEMAREDYVLKRKRVEDLMPLKGYKYLKEVAADAGFSHPRQFDRWEKKGIKSEDLGVLADLLGTTMDYLANRVNDPSVHLDPGDLTEQEVTLLAAVRLGHFDELLELVARLHREQNRNR